MDIRKEQALLLGTLGILALLYVNRGAANVSTKLPRAKVLDIPPIAQTAEVLFMGGAKKIGDLKRDLFVEPSDISVLPPLEAPDLGLPDLPDLPVVLPLLRLGVDTSHWFIQRMPQKQIQALGKGTQLAKATGTGGTPPTSGEEATETVVPTTLEDVDPQAEKEKIWAKQYDLVIYKGHKHWGRILNKDPYRLGRPNPDAQTRLLEIQGPFPEGLELVYRKMNPERGSVSIARFKVTGEDLAEVSLIRFADTVSNVIAMKRVRLPAGEIGLPEREAFILELLTKYRDYPEAFRVAEEQALLYIENNKVSPRGHELLCLVYSVSGQLEKQLAKYQDLMQGEHRKESFIYRGLGTLEARLGMDEAAEEHLKQAVNLKESDAKARFALARFLRNQSRGVEALEQAERAVKNMGQKLRSEEAFAISSLYVACLLSEGKVAEASTALLQAGSHLTGTPEDSPAYNLLMGAVSYEEGKFEEAANAFAVAAEGMSDPVLPATGQALAHFRQGKINDAMSAAEGGLNRDPLERYRVLVVKGFLLGSQDKIDAAVETFQQALGMAPREPYSLYILGRWLSKGGRFDEAEDVLEDVLSRHAEIVEVMAEYALMLMRQAEAAGFSAEAHGLLLRAERYAKKVCEIEEGRARLWIYQDLLGVIRYYLRNNDGARAAFQQAIAWAPLDEQAHPKIFLTLLDYRDGRTDDTLAQLRDIRETLQPESELRGFIGKLIKQIEDHANLRVFRTGFELAGKVGKDFRESKVKPRWKKSGGNISVNGKSDGQPVWMRKTVTRGAGKLVEVSVQLKVGAEFGGSRAFLRITDKPIKTGGRSSQSKFEYVVGYDRGLRVFLKEGVAEKKPIIDRREARGDFRADGLSFKRGETHQLGFKIERGDGGGRQAVLIVLLDGREIDRAKVSVFGFGRGRDLHLDLWIEGDRRSMLQATFDDFMLTRFAQ